MVIPTYNRLESVIRAVNSVVRQSYPITEVLVIDDGSSDSFSIPLSDFCQSIDKCRYIRVEHSGNPSIVRNIGINGAVGELIAFLDSDDFWLPNKIEAQVSLIHKLNVDFVCTNALLSSSKNNGTLLELKESMFLNLSLLLKSNLVITSSVLMRKSLIVDVKGFDEDSFHLGYEDYLTWLKIIYRSKGWVEANPYLVYSDLSQDSLSLRISSVEKFIHERAVFVFLLWLRQTYLRKSPFSRFLLFFLQTAIKLDIKLAKRFVL